jgi:hypothetical protein
MRCMQWGPISGGHFNPAVTVGLWAGGRFPSVAAFCPMFVAQVVGATIGGGDDLYLIASGKAGVDASSMGLASNGFGEHSPGGIMAMLAGLCDGIRDDGGLPVSSSWGRPHRVAQSRWLRAGGDRAGADADPPDLDPGDQHVGQSGALDGPGLAGRRHRACSRSGCSGWPRFWAASLVPGSTIRFPART